jgi:ubiquitin-like protein Pup
MRALPRHRPDRDHHADSRPPHGELTARQPSVTTDPPDEIDEVLEENAEELVRSYVQKGGQFPCNTATHTRQDRAKFRDYSPVSSATR